MKAIIRAGAGLVGLFLVASLAQAYVWVSPVFKTPLQHAPDVRTSAVYYYDAYGRLIGPFYNLTPPFQPFTMPLPGKTGQAIQSGYLPHTLLLSKEGLSIGNVPMLGGKQEHGSAPNPNGSPGAGLPNLSGGGAPGQYPTLGTPAMHQYGPMQAPGMSTPSGPYALPMSPGMMPYQQMQAPQAYGQRPGFWAPYPMPMPMPMQAQPYPYPMPMQGQPYPYPMPMQPYPMQPAPQMPNAAWQWAPGGIYLTQGTNGAPSPFRAIPGFSPVTPPMPVPPGMPAMPAMPAMPTVPMAPFAPGSPMAPVAPNDGFQFFTPFDPMSRMQAPMPPSPNMERMQLPRLDLVAPPMQRVGGSAYPVHPFTRSPRDFFMWDVSMEEERARSGRP
jgi:hypothetical protein